MRSSGDTGASDALPIRIVLVLACFVPAICPAQTSADPSADWACLRCVITEGWRLDMRAGPGLAADDAFRFGDFTGVHHDGAYLFGDLFGDYRTADGQFASIEAWSRGTSAYGLFSEGGKQGVYRARASIQSIPRHFFDTTSTPFRRAADSRLVLPPEWVRASTTSLMTELQGNAVPVTIGFDRSLYQFGVDIEPQTDWQLSIDYRHQQRDGNIRSSAGMLFSALEFVSPVDYSTDDVEVMLDYYGSNWQLGIGYFNSVFRNSNDHVQWDNPYNVVPGARFGQQAQPPDNDAQRVTLAGYVSLPARTSIAGSLSTGTLQQNAQLLPFTTNPAFPVAPLPSTHANARADTTSFDLRVTSSPWSRLTLSGDLEFRDFDNETPAQNYDYIVTDALAAANPGRSRAYDFDKREFEFRAQYRQSSGTKLEIGAELERFVRSGQSRRRTDTERLWVSARTRAGSMNELSVEIFDERRDGSSYESILDATTPENPLMRKYHLADRDRRGATFRSAFVGGDRSDFGFEIELSNDRYDESVLGITDTDYARIGADYSLLYSERTTLYVGAYKERFESSQSNSQSFGAADWTSTIDDDFDTVTVGGNIAELFGIVELDFEAGWSQSIGQIGNDASAAVSALPDVRSRRRYARIGAAWPYSERLDVRFDYFYESLDTSDWALDGVEPATAPALLSLGAAAWRYRVNVLYFSVALSLAP